MWTSNSGDPFNQPSKSCTKWLLVMYKPGGGGGGGGGDPPPPLPPPSPQSIRHCSRAGRAGGGRLWGDREVRLHRHDGEHRRRRRNLGIEHLTVPLGIERDRRVVVS